jgi:probable rRNA maturation factor
MSKNTLNISKKTGYKIPVKISWLRKIEETILHKLNLDYAVELDIFITDDADIKKLNKDHRKLDKPTDVLSFYMEEPEPVDFINPPDGIVHLGEIVISFKTAARDAGRQKISIEEELGSLLIHGTLHLLGYDHEKAAEGRIMRKKEDEIFRLLQLDVP